MWKISGGPPSAGFFLPGHMSQGLSGGILHMAASQKRWPRRLLRGGIALVVIVLLGLYVIMPLAFGFAATLPVAVTVGAPPDGFTDVTLTAD